MIEACNTCETLWRLYSRAADNLRELVGKHGEARGRGEQQPVEILSHEIAIAESALRTVRRELRRHEMEKHTSRPENHTSKPDQKHGQTK
jgi:hypothetical protein